MTEPSAVDQPGAAPTLRSVDSPPRADDAPLRDGLDAPLRDGADAPLRDGADRITERIDDLARVVARQAATIERLADESRARARIEQAEADAPLIRDLFALHGLAQTFSTTTESDPDRQGFEALARRVERMLAERGGQLVTPFRGAAFDALTMEAAELTDTDDPAADRTVESVIQPGLTIGERSIRPAKVVVRRYRRPLGKSSVLSD
ncbi:nucleotide exchange factor GrpE [Nocardia sp. NPDC020380]|uniref:nucleotide exchange factor GrpE n=1 Tax=Nocardia sp. NPDC020380 TaxID=3364309 RepID=UPI0037ABFD4F